MWIRTQNRQKIVNTDQVISIFVDRTGMLVLAEMPRASIDQGTSLITLGEYKDRDTCLEVLNKLLKVSICRYAWEEMPFGDDVKSWAKDIEDNC